MKCGVSDSQVRIVYSPFTRDGASPPLVLVYFKVRVCVQAGLHGPSMKYSINGLSVESGFGYLCIYFVTT